MRGIIGGIGYRTGGFCIPEKITKKYEDVSMLPIYFQNGGQTVIYNNEIHVLGGDNINNSQNPSTWHYKFTNGSWVKASTLPYAFSYGVAVVYNNEIHILGGTARGTDSSVTNKHYKWNGTTWTIVSTLPISFTIGLGCVYNNEIHILGGTNSQLAHYKWNGTSWSSASTLPQKTVYGAICVYNNEIHILGSNIYGSSPTAHHKWNGATWTKMSNLPFDCYSASAVVYKNTIYINCGSELFYVYNSSEDTWYNISSEIKSNHYSKTTVVYNDQIHFLAGANGSSLNDSIHYKFYYVNNLVLNIPSNSKILCTGVSLLNEASLISQKIVSKTSYGYDVLKNSVITIVRDETNTNPVTVLNGREIIYVEDTDKYNLFKGMRINNSAIASSGIVNKSDYSTDGNILIEY